MQRMERRGLRKNRNEFTSKKKILPVEYSLFSSVFQNYLVIARCLITMGALERAKT